VAMQDIEYGLPRIPIPRTLVNRARSTLSCSSHRFWYGILAAKWYEKREEAQSVVDR
jgi:hypothetical protein